MSTQFFSKLSQNYIELLEDDEYYDITIEVGEDPNVKIFRAHMNILCYRSPYLRRELASKKMNNDRVLTHIKLPNLSPEIFQAILKYIYGGILSLDKHDTSEFLKVLVAADMLCLQELIDYLQKHLIENFIIKSPKQIFNSDYFTSLPEKLLVQIIKRDDLQMEEIEIWEHVLKWGLAQNSTLLPDPNTWSDEDFKAMENTLQRCLPSIRFFCLSSREFSQYIRPYKKLLKHQFYEDLLNSYLDPSNISTDNILPPRNFKIDSKIVNLGIASTISRWIDKIKMNDTGKFAHIRYLYLPYKFELLLRGSRDGFTPKKFHELCNDKPITITFIKVKGTEEIIGGYNPKIWKSSKDDIWNKVNDSFIFSFKNKDNFIEDAIISNVKNADLAILYNNRAGPFFGGDIRIFHTSNEYEDYDYIEYKKRRYEKKIKNSEGKFLIEDYEVFQIVKDKAGKKNFLNST